MNLSLFIIVLGGRSLKSNIEIHDVRWVLGETLEDTFAELRDQWIGNVKGLHIDSYKRVKYIDGYKIDISKVELYYLRRQIGIVPQDSILFDGTVQENISLTDRNP